MPLFSAGMSRRQGGGSGSQLNATLAKKSANVRDKAHLKRTLSTIEKDSLRYKVDNMKPWMDEDGTVVWSQSRILVAEWVLSQTFETIMGVIIAINICIMVVETDADATCYPSYDAQTFLDCPTRSATIIWLQVVNILLLGLYTIECFLRAYVERAKYPCNRWNQIDLVTVVLGWTGVFLSNRAVNFNVLRIIRVVRLMRAARVVISIPEFYILVSGLTSSFKAILFGSVMLLSVILVWAIIAVELLHVENVQIQHVSTCWRCEDAFKSVYDAALTIFQQIVAGDSWGELSIPLALHQPWTAILLFAIMMTISLGCMNLILAVIVERATEARENDQQRKMQKKDAEQESYMVEMALLCDSMDIDGNGHLSLEEMLEGYDHNPEFKNLMQQMDIRRSDIKTIFNVLDGDCSGEVSYVEFCQQLGTCRKRDPIMMHSLIKYSVMELQKSIQHDIMEKLNEHTEALIEQREMLHEELQLLYALPVDPKVKETAQKRRAQRVLRRQGKKQGNPQYFDSNVTDNSATTYGPTPEASSAANQVINSLESTCRSFEDTQSELQALVKHAEELTSLALSPEQPGRETGDQLEQAAQAGPVIEGLLDEGLQEKGKSVSFETDAGQLDGELERRFSSLLKTLRHRMSEEEELQRRCKEAIQTIDMLCLDGRGRYFYC